MSDTYGDVYGATYGAVGASPAVSRDSLLIDGRFELLGGGQASTLPQCEGAVFRLAPGFSLDAPHPDTTTVISLLLDGERPVGYRASNRAVKLPVIVFAPTREILAAAVEALLQAIDQDQWQMTWTRAGGLPVVFDCYRAKAASVNYHLIHQQQAGPMQALTISFPALPYLHSDQPVTLTFDSPFAGTVAPPSSIELDNYNTVSGSGWVQSSQHVLDSHSAYWSNGSGGYPTYSAAVSSTDISDLSAITFWFGLGTGFELFWGWNGGNVTFSVTLTDSSGDTVRFGTTQYCSASNNAGSPNWQQITIPLPDDSEFDWGQVTAYEFSCWSASLYGSGRTMQASVYLNAFTVAPASASTPASTRGWLATLYGILGTAHAPLAVQFQLLVAGLATQAFTTAGDFSAVIPSGITTGRVRLTGPGGNAASLTTTGEGGGGSGGGYGEEPTYPLQGGTTMHGHVGAPGTNTTFDTGGIGGGVLATAGTSATAGSSAGATATDTSTNSIHHKGGNGASGTGSGGGIPAIVQTKAGTFAGTSGTITLNSPTGSGNDLAVLVSAFGGSTNPSVQSIKLGASTDHFSQAASAAAQTNPPAVYAWVDKNCAAGQTAVSITLTGGAGTLGTNVEIYEVSGCDTSSPVDQTDSGGTAATPYDSGTTGTTSTANEIFLGMAATWDTVNTTTISGPSSGWNNLTRQQQAVGTYYILSVASSKIVSSTQTARYTGAYTTGDESNALVITLKGGSSTAGGGGGSSAGTSADGNPGSGPSGGSPPTGAGSGGAGATSAGPGTAGSAPGGGGGGPLSTGSAEAGGAGAAGQAILTYSGTALASFKTLVAHIPGPNAPASLVPFVSVGNGADTPNGGTEYAIQASAPGVNARFNGTYSILAVAETINSPSTSRTVTLTIKEYEYSGGPATSIPVARTFTPDTTGAVDLTSGLNGFVALGEVTLPQRDIAPDNTASYFTVTMTDTDTSDRWLDVLFIDTSGQLVLCNLSSAYTNYFVDVPDQTSDLGRILASQADRNQAASVLANAIVSGGPLLVNPGDNTLLAYAVEGAPSIVATYRPAYRIDRPN
jgi:hypothetical protein